MGEMRLFVPPQEQGVQQSTPPAFLHNLSPELWTFLSYRHPLEDLSENPYEAAMQLAKTYGVHEDVPIEPMELSAPLERSSYKFPILGLEEPEHSVLLGKALDSNGLVRGYIALKVPHLWEGFDMASDFYQISGEMSAQADGEWQQSGIQVLENGRPASVIEMLLNTFAHAVGKVETLEMAHCVVYKPPPPLPGLPKERPDEEEGISEQRRAA